MNDQSVFSRISSWFKPGHNGDSAHLPLEHDRTTLADPESHRDGPIPVTTFLKPWAKRDAALVQLQEGFNTLNHLVGSVKENLDRQAQRQDELLRLLQHLPEALRAIPENSRTQTETLKVVGEQLQRHNVHYHRLADVLEKVSDSATDQKQTLDALNERVDTISQHDRSMADNMRSVSSAMHGVSENTQASAQVLDQLRNDARTRDNEFLRILNRQRVRITAMLGVAILVSVTALAAVCLIGWKMLGR
jgi:DNA repair ATPase RecN